MTRKYVHHERDYLISVVRNITERKQTEDALKESEASLTHAQMLAHLGSWNWDIIKNELRWSDEMFRIFGIFPQKFEATYEAFINVIHPDDREFVKQSVDKAINKKKPYNIDYRVVRPDDSERIVNAQGNVIFDETGRAVSMLGTVLDITERKMAEEKIKEYSENLEKMVEERTDELKQALNDTEVARDRIDGIIKSVADGLVVTDKYNNILLMNRAAEDLLGVRFSEMINKPIEYAIEDNTLREKLVHTFKTKKTNYQFDFQLPGDDPKHPRIMRARTSNIFGKNSEKTGVVTIISDVTLEREVDRMKTDFISTAAHELRTPLTSIVGFSKILTEREDISEEERDRFLSYINKQGVHLANIVGDLLDISRIESGKGYTLDKRKNDICEIIKEIIPYFQEISLEHEFNLVLPDESIEMIIDKEKIEQVIKNILSNAIKYSPDGGEIVVLAEIVKKDLMVSIEDHGLGMTPEQVEKTFDKFYRVDASDSAPEGTGLGMVIVKHVVESHGGKVWVESEFGKGTAVRFTIPLRKKSKVKK